MKFLTKRSLCQNQNFSEKTIRIPLEMPRLRDPDINPCMLIPFYLLNDASLTSVRNLMLPSDVWMQITMTRKSVLLTSRSTKAAGNSGILS
uniref:Coiled-coil-helix-coiled-coil-helix domain containing 7 n=2 Tax=Cebus imitator TaxID=2715852 RepID=A0A2K5R4F2_CEBIM